MARPAYELVTAPSAEPIARDTAKAHCRVTSDAENDLFDRIIASARRHVESTYGVALINQTHRATIDVWDLKGVELRPHPVASLSNVKAWIGAAFVAQDLASFQLAPGRPARVFMADGATVPLPSRTRAGITLEFVAGFGADEAAIPEDITQALLMLIAHWYENREAVVVGAKETKVTSELSRGVGDLMFPYRSFRLA